MFASGPFHSLWVRYPDACFGLVLVAASVSEWTKNHSLTLAATKIEKRGADMMGGLVECLGAGPEDFYFWPGPAHGGIRSGGLDGGSAVRVSEFPLQPLPMNLPSLWNLCGRLPALGLAILLPAQAIRAQSLTLTPLKPAGIYEVGESVGWQVSVPEGGSFGRLNYTLKRNGLTVFKADTIDLSSGQASLTTVLDEPGTVLLEIQLPPPPAAAPAATGTVAAPARGPGRGGRAARTLAGAMVAPRKLKPSSPRPADFDAWWAAKIKQLHEIPVNAQLTAVESAKPNVDYAKITMDNINGTHIQGQIAKPSGAGKHPALLLLQWAGGAYSLPPSRVVDRAAEGWLALNIEPHDIAFDQPREYYAELNRGPLGNFQSIGQADRETSYFLAMYLSAYRALDYLTSREDWDGKILVVKGESMGGQQSIAMAGLYPKITAVVAEIPSGIDVTGPEHGSAAGFPDWARDAKSKNNPKILETAQYFDAMNFASRMTVPAFIAMGAYDETSPPVGVWRAINLMKGPVEPMIMNVGHQEVTVNGVNNHAPYKQRAAEWLAVLVKGEAVKLK